MHYPLLVHQRFLCIQSVHRFYPCVLTKSPELLNPVCADPQPNSPVGCCVLKKGAGYWPELACGVQEVRINIKMHPHRTTFGL